MTKASVYFAPVAFLLAALPRWPQDAPVAPAVPTPAVETPAPAAEAAAGPARTGPVLHRLRPPPTETALKPSRTPIPTKQITPEVIAR
jgi:hypothetical protein